jgi:hypothetical protein
MLQAIVDWFEFTLIMTKTCYAFNALAPLLT